MKIVTSLYKQVNVMRIQFCMLCLVMCGTLSAQSFTSFRTGSDTSIDTIGELSLTLMGGATENDSAMVWFLEKANGGDVLVIRASGADGYNDYLFSELGVTVNSVETIVWNNAEASADPYVLTRLQEAEAIWIAGGDQAVYVDYWRDSEVNTIVTEKLNTGTLAIGGTSAGAAILGNYYFSAANGTITAEEALNNPLDDRITLDTIPFFDVPIGGPFLDIKFMTDTHFDNPDRRGRLLAFTYILSSRIDEVIFGIGLDEFTGLTITSNGLMTVYGDYPNEEDQIRMAGNWCGSFNPLFGSNIDQAPLTLEYRRGALPMLTLKGLPTGNTLSTYEFSIEEPELRDFEYSELRVTEGTFKEYPIFGIVGYCIASTDDLDRTGGFELSPNPANDQIFLTIPEGEIIDRLTIFDTLGSKVATYGPVSSLNVAALRTGVYQLVINGKYHLSFVKE